MKTYHPLRNVPMSTVSKLNTCDKLHQWASKFMQLLQQKQSHTFRGVEYIIDLNVLLSFSMSRCHFLMGLSGPTDWMYSFACFGVGFSELGWSSFSTLPSTKPLLKLTPTVKNLLCQRISGASIIHHPQFMNERLIVH